MSDALPIIRNASIIRLKLIAMKPGEILEVSPQELPPSYKSVKKVTSNIQKHYAYYFAVLKLSDKPGWKVLRVNNAEEAESYVPKKKKAGAGKTDEPVRLYNMPDADLMQLIDEKIKFARRDAADLAPRGVTAVLLDALQADNEVFKEMEGDVQMRSGKGEAAEIKTTARNTLESRLGNLRTMAQNTFGSGSVGYGAFGLEGIVSVEDAVLLLMAKKAWREGTTNQALMAAWGCSPAFLGSVENDIEIFETEIIDLRVAESERKKATALRVTTGNDLYIRTEKICNTGKDVYRETDPAKHNDYLIYS